MIVNKVVDGGPALHIPGDLSFGQYVINKLREHCKSGGGIALVNGETGQETTFQQILQDVANFATGLKKLGVRRGDVVTLCSESRVEYIVAAVAAICCGAAVTPVNLNYSKEELTHVLNISKPTIVIGSEAALRQNLAKLKSIPYIKKLIQFDGRPLEWGILSYSDVIVDNVNVDEFSAEDVQGWSDVAFILYSSGTTGLPKGVLLTHMNVLYGAAHYSNSAVDNIELSILLTVVPWYHGYGLLGTINHMAVKKTLVYFSGFNPDLYLGSIQKYKVQVLMAVPPIVVLLAKSPIVDKFDLSSVRVVWCAAAPLRSDTIQEALKRLPKCIGIFQAYGMTETTLAATRDVTSGNINLKAGSGGVPLPGIKVKVEDIETRQKLGPNAKGEICIKGPIVMKGYAGDDSATKDIMDGEGYLKTGDIGYYDEEGFVFIVDRLKEIIKYKGNQVAPAEVESVILQHPAVAECGVAGAPDERAGELATAFVVVKPGAQLSERDLLHFTAAKLSSPKRLHGGVIFVKEIPKNPSGKILRRVLREKLINTRKSKL